ncbi:hypothetical protein AKJ09_06861 [Labilithrix luteola]|uniref:Tetratricopeptide repeat protein n=1 Tax=Labilithrix luteola TaxID=1391654 RepID=A0A0K1Q377_9BACT|nr:hypothetical protein [Labilithrix luteola]AKV00198.1 hypothetical protein AKJ09_06861 [Labilithrix luteola]
MSSAPHKKPSLLAPLEHEDDPTDADAERVLAKIQASLASAAASSEASAPASPGRSSASAIGSKKALLVGLSFAAMAVVGTIWIHESMERSTPSSAAGPLEAAPAAPPPTPKLPREPAIESDPPIPSIAVNALPTVKGVESTPPNAKRSAPSEASATVTPTNDALEREARLLASARRALQEGEAGRALALLDEHARTFPNGWLAVDRAAERIIVLCSLGRRDEAVREAKTFLDGRPKSPLTRRVELSCAGQP